jgi:Flp pilus assembly protein TadG
MNRRGLFIRLRRAPGASEGTAAVEFALVLPIMIVLLFGFVEIGRLFWSYQIASAAVRDGARLAARLPMDCGSLTGAGDLTRVKNLVRTGAIDGTGSPLVAGWTDSASVAVAVSCIDNSGGTYSGRYLALAGIPKVQVTATVPFSFMFGPLFGNSTMTSFQVANQQAWTQ